MTAPKVPAALAGVPEHDGMYPNVPEAAYHADRGSLSFSGAKLLVPPSAPGAKLLPASSPAHFRDVMDNPRKPKRAYDFGHLAHRELLGKGAEIAVLDPDIHGRLKNGARSRTPRATDSWKEAEAAARERGQTPVHIDEYRAAMAMVNTLRKHPEAGPLFAGPGHAEVAMYWTDPLTGVRLRGRADWITVLHGRVWIVDYKTTDISARKEDFDRIAAKLGYFMQAAWYYDLATAIGWVRYPVFAFVVQEKSSPHAIGVFEPDAQTMAAGREANRAAIDVYARCMATKQWPSYPGSERVQSFSLPAYAFSHTTVDDVLTDEYDDDTDD